MPNLLANRTFGIRADGSEATHWFKAKSIKYNWESIASEDSGRTLDGVMHIYWLLRNIRKIEIVMPPTTYGDIKEIMSIVQGREYYITFFDPSTGSWIEKYVYTSNANSEMYSGVVLNGLYQGFEFHAIELGGE